MFGRNQRLRKNEVELLFKKGKSVSVHHFFVRSRKNLGEKSRFCIMFDKKISIESHQRIRLRRQIYEAIRRNEELIRESLDIAYIIKPSLLKVPRKKIEPAVVEGLTSLEKFYG